MSEIPRSHDKAAIGARLQLTRQALRLTQTDFAENARIARSAYTQYENGGKRPSIENAISLCETYGLTLDWIFRGEMSGVEMRTARAILALLDAPEH